jgi:hypothetical protein
LCISAAIASEYQTLKIQLAKQYPQDREKYTQGKWPFIKKVLAFKFFSILAYLLRVYCYIIISRTINQ